MGLLDEDEVVLAQELPPFFEDLNGVLELLVELVEPISTDDLVHFVVDLGEDGLEVVFGGEEEFMVRVVFTCVLDDLLEEHLVPCDFEGRLQELVVGYLLG